MVVVVDMKQDGDGRQGRDSTTTAGGTPSRAKRWSFFGSWRSHKKSKKTPVDEEAVIVSSASAPPPSTKSSAVDLETRANSPSSFMSRPHSMASGSGRKSTAKSEKEQRKKRRLADTEAAKDPDREGNGGDFLEDVCVLFVDRFANFW